METMTMIGLILVIVGVVLSPFTCLTTLFISLLGVILIIIGETSKKSVPPLQYPTQYPPQPIPPYPPSHPATPYTCPICGGSSTYISQYNRWYCYSCSKYL